jgi:hypothetical protein
VSQNPISDEELRNLLASLDPMSGIDVEPVTSPQARHRLEQIMQIDQNTNPADNAPADPSNVVSMRRHKARLILAAAASVAVVGLGTVVAGNLNGDTGSVNAPEATVLALKAPGGDPMMQMCLAFDVAALRTMPVALAGTVTSLADKTVTLDVDRWYKGGDAEQVTIALPPGDISPALIPGVDFVQGEQFLVTAAEGTVNGCGFSGPATAEMKKSFDEAFGG